MLILILGARAFSPTLVAQLTNSDEVTLGHAGVGAGAGDIDGDGLPEVLVATPDRFDCDACAVQLHVYTGVPGGVDPTPVVIAGPPWDDVDEPVVVTVLGDTDGDGYAEVAVGAGGTVWVYAGSAAGLGATPVQALSGYANDTQAVVAGDVNADGYRDLIIGSAYTPWVTDAGSVDLFFGGPTGIAATPDQVLSDGGYDEMFGAGLAVGDVDGDGYDDALVGEPLAMCATTGDYDGAASLHRGSAAGFDTTAAWTSECLRASGWFGASTALVDLDGDGALDFVVASPEADELSVWANSGGLPATTFSAVSGAGTFGSWLASVGDVDGDGLDDVVATSPDMGDGGGWSVIGPSFAVTVELSGSPGAALGQVVGTGDLDGDGIADLVVPTADDGIAWLVPGASGGPDDAKHTTLAGTVYDARYGARLAGVGDVDGDGFDELIVAADHADVGTIDGGAAWLYRGTAAGIEPAAAQQFEGGTTGDHFGVVAAVGDLNGDGLAEVLLGGPAGEYAAGTASLYLGDPSGLVFAATIEGDSTRNGGIGYALTAAGDTNGDGFADAAIGAPQMYTADSAKLGMLYGAASPGDVEWTEQPYEAADTDGGWAESLAGGSDLNGDGYDDVALGQPTDYGMIWIYYGSALGVTYTYDWFVGAYGLDDFGFALAVDDFDGDGFGDIAVGAPDQDSSPTKTGSVLLYPGSAGGLPTTPTVEQTGPSAGSEFGISLVTLGDVDGDGTADLWVGAEGADQAWRCVAGLTSCVALDGAAGEHFGAAVGEGDFDGDGAAELVVGAPGAVGGAVYVYSVDVGEDTGDTGEAGDTGSTDSGTIDSEETGSIDSGETGSIDSGETGSIDSTDPTDSDPADSGKSTESAGCSGCSSTGKLPAWTALFALALLRRRR